MTSCNCTNCVGFGSFCGSAELWVLLGVVCAMLLLCGGWSLLAFISKQCTDGGKKFLPRFRRSLSLRQRDMEDNPIYGNITYTQIQLSSNSASASEHQTLKSTTQPCPVQQDCYANLTLKAPKPPSARSSPKIQYSDVMTLPRTKDQAEAPVDMDTVSIRSDLYASVDPERSKTLANNKDYANHV